MNCLKCGGKTEHTITRRGLAPDYRKLDARVCTNHENCVLAGFPIDCESNIDKVSAFMEKLVDLEKVKATRAFYRAAMELRASHRANVSKS
jgi:hypothetical protein